MGYITEEVFYKYRYKRVQAKYGYKGVICGYQNESLLIGLDKPMSGGPSMKAFADRNPHMIVYREHPDNDMYRWIHKEDILEILEDLEPKLTDDGKAEQYIKANFPNLSDDDIDIYINVFIAGVNSTK